MFIIASEDLRSGHKLIWFPFYFTNQWTKWFSWKIIANSSLQMTMKETGRTQMEFWIPSGFLSIKIGRAKKEVNYVWLANLLWNKYGMPQCRLYQPLFSKIILEIHLASFLLEDSPTFYKLWVEMFPREIGEKHSRKGQYTLPVLQWYWKLFEFKIVTAYIPPIY